MIRASVISLRLVAFIAALFSLIACAKSERDPYDPGLLYGSESQTPIDLTMMVFDESLEHNLMNPDAEGSIAGISVTADFMGRIHTLDAEEEFGLSFKTLYDFRGKAIGFTFGTLDGRTNYPSLVLKLNWSDGHSDSIIIFNMVSVDKEGLSVTERHIWYKEKDYVNKNYIPLTR